MQNGKPGLFKSERKNNLMWLKNMKEIIYVAYILTEYTSYI